MIPVKFNPDDHTYFDEKGRQIPSVSWILEHFGISQIKKLVAIHGQDHFDNLARFGKELHTITAADDIGVLETIQYDNELDPWLAGWRKFREEHPMDFLLIEQPLMSSVWGFAGTPDRVSLKELPDIKSGDSTVAERVQTALYQILAEENLGIRITKRYAVHVKAWGYSIEPHNDPVEMTVAKSMLTILNYKRKKGLL